MCDILIKSECIFKGNTLNIYFIIKMFIFSL